jgi:hypothetical protein
MPPRRGAENSQQEALGDSVLQRENSWVNKDFGSEKNGNEYIERNQ